MALTTERLSTDPDRHHLLESPPSIGWVVHEVVSVKPGTGPVWAWCKVEVSGPGYAEIVFTAADGHTPADPGTATLRLGPVITKVWC